ncbi:MAG TPA: hypothetical protein DCQ98_16630 [Planctomycetaceae bacterium]|nr:hypothetical protein [Planctomycetaceae bacterium]
MNLSGCGRRRTDPRAAQTPAQRISKPRSAQGPICPESPFRSKTSFGARVWARVVLDARPSDLRGRTELRSSIGVAIALPRLGTSRGHSGCRPRQQPNQPEAQRRDQPFRDTVRPGAVAGGGRADLTGVARGVGPRRPRRAAE